MVRLTLVHWGFELIRTAPLSMLEAGVRYRNWKAIYGKNVRILTEGQDG